MAKRSAKSKDREVLQRIYNVPQNDDLAGIMLDEGSDKVRKKIEERRPHTVKYTPTAGNKSDKSERS